MRSLCGSRFLVAGSLAVSVLSLVIAGRSLAYQDRAVDAQAIARMVEDAENDASKLAKQQRLGEAVAVLQRALDQVEASNSLTEAKRDSLRRELKRYMREFDPKTAVVQPPPPPKPIRPAIDDGKKPFDTAKGLFDDKRQALADNADIKRRTGEANLALDRQILEANIPPTVDYKLPADWLEKSKRRTKVTMTDQERTILRELNKTRTVDFDGQTLDQVIKYLSKSMGVNINVTRADLELVGASYDTPIKLDMKNVSTRSVLKKMLADLNLTYIIEGESIEIMAKERAKTKVTTRTYYVGDLVAVSRSSPYPQVQVYQQAAQLQQIQALMVMIQKSYDPDSWDVNGGPGSITFDPVSMSFVIKQTAEMHFLMGVGMR